MLDTARNASLATIREHGRTLRFSLATMFAATLMLRPMPQAPAATVMIGFRVRFEPIGIELCAGSPVEFWSPSTVQGLNREPASGRSWSPMACLTVGQ
jgi:hypothetical protein